MWSIGNEVGEQASGDSGAAMARELTAIVHEEDPTRPTIGADELAPSQQPVRRHRSMRSASTTKAPASAAGRPNIRSFITRFPDKFIFGSETASSSQQPRLTTRFPCAPASARPRVGQRRRGTPASGR